MDSENVSEEFLVEAVKRAPLFELLTEEPHEPNELAEKLDASRSTVHRATQSFVEKGLLRKSNDRFELTGLGRAVADEVVGFRERITAANKLRSFLNTVDLADVDVPMGAFADADVIHPKPRQPHFAVKRIADLIEVSQSVHMFSSIISPFYVDVAYRELLDGTEIEVVFDPEVVEIVASEYAEEAQKAAEAGDFRVLVQPGVPFELFIFDDCIGMAANDESGIARVFVETDAPRAVEWAETVYESYRNRADPLDTSAF
jgi:predicted transcriptional regulator